MPSALVLNVGVVLAVSTLAFSLMLLLVSVVSWRRVGSVKLLIAGGAFAILAAKGAVGSWRAIVDRETDLVTVGLDFAVLGFLYLSVAVR